jgi:hypothetical protein
LNSGFFYKNPFPQAIDFSQIEANLPRYSSFNIAVQAGIEEGIDWGGDRAWHRPSPLYDYRMSHCDSRMVLYNFRVSLFDSSTNVWDSRMSLYYSRIATSVSSNSTV